MSSSRPTFPKRPEWQQLYEEAVLELDRAVLPVRVRAAKTAIQTRILELRTEQPTEESSRLEDALKILNSLTKMYE